ncbi:MAG: 4'-phosphopantetheinyl transferase superfamily protein [Neisseria sp.]|nr:4'-phosphopantetheinyl transferase superfamily protein [Neisseria sp.]
MTKPVERLFCLSAGPAAGVFYDDAPLDEADAGRLAGQPRLAERPDWRTSRFLKAQARHEVLSLSHSRGYAALLAGRGGLRCGVDVEVVRPRDFAALASWVCDGGERVFLTHGGWRAEDFYRLWCVKEALVKAAGLVFPADMVRVGLVFCDEGCRLRVDGESGWRGLSALLDGRLALACVWQGDAVLEWGFYGGLDAQALGGVVRYGESG